MNNPRSSLLLLFLFLLMLFEAATWKFSIAKSGTFLSIQESSQHGRIRDDRGRGTHDK